VHETIQLKVRVVVALADMRGLAVQAGAPVVSPLPQVLAEVVAAARTAALLVAVAVAAVALGSSAKDRMALVAFSQLAPLAAAAALALVEPTVAAIAAALVVRMALAAAAGTSLEMAVLALSEQSVLSGPVRRAPSHRLIQGTYKCPVIPACGASPSSFKVAVRDCGLRHPARQRLARQRP
jgi:hypothetical protein